MSDIFEGADWTRAYKRLSTLISNEDIYEDQQGNSKTYAMWEYEPFNLMDCTLEELEDMWQVYIEHEENEDWRKDGEAKGDEILKLLISGEWGDGWYF